MTIRFDACMTRLSNPPPQEESGHIADDLTAAQIILCQDAARHSLLRPAAAAIP
jgi:hypothetical protein